MSKAIKVTLTAEFASAVEEYRAQHKIESLAKAVAILAAIGYETETGKEVSPVNPHGGWRGNEASIEALMRYADKVTDKGRNDPVHYVEEDDEQIDT